MSNLAQYKNSYFITRKIQKSSPNNIPPPKKALSLIILFLISFSLSPSLQTTSLTCPAATSYTLPSWVGGTNDNTYYLSIDIDSANANFAVLGMTKDSGVMNPDKSQTPILTYMSIAGVISY